MRVIPFCLFAPLVVPSLAAAQSTAFSYAVDAAQSNFVWNGTSTLGAIVGNPTNQFQMAGSAALLESAALPLAVGSGAFNGGDVNTVQDLHGKINNILPFLPPLATIDVLGLHLAATSPSFAVDAAGNYSTTVTFTALAGTLVVTPLGSGPTSTDLTGQSSLPTAVAGTLVVAGTDLALAVPINTVFAFNDPTTGTSGSITLIGTLRARWNWPAPVIFCSPKVNSLGCTPQLTTIGIPRATASGGFTVQATNVMNNKVGLLLHGTTGAANLPFQGGTLCVNAPLKRTPGTSSGGNPPPNDCSGTFAVDLCAFAAGGLGGNPLAALREPGTVVHCQWWGRDPGFAAPNNSTLSAGVTYTVAP